MKAEAKGLDAMLGRHQQVIDYKRSRSFASEEYALAKEWAAEMWAALEPVADDFFNRWNEMVRTEEAEKAA